MKVRLKLRPRFVGGVSCPRPIIRLRLRDEYGALVDLDFRIDTQADVTSIPVSVARQEHIAFTTQDRHTVSGLVGRATAFRGIVRVSLAGQEHVWPCDFVDAPDGGAVESRPGHALSVIGRAGFLDDYAVAIDAGFLIITHLGPVRRQIRRVLQFFWNYLGMIHPERKPL